MPTQAALKDFLQLQKQCSKYLGTSTTSRLSNARRIMVIGCVGKKEGNESKNCWSTVDFKHFEHKNGFFAFSLLVSMPTQVALKNFLQLQQQCSKYLGTSTTPRLSNADRIMVIGCVGKKVRNESKNWWSTADFEHFEQNVHFFAFSLLVSMTTQVALKIFYRFKNNIQSIWGHLQHPGFLTHVESWS